MQMFSTQLFGIDRLETFGAYIIEPDINLYPACVHSTFSMMTCVCSLNNDEC